MKALGQAGLDFIAGKFKELKKLLSDKVDKVDGKGLSTNDYDGTAKSKVDAIPANPKYTDTTYDLSKYAEKSNISRCKTKGYGSASSWSNASTERDLEDWIGDFDKRTRELKSGGGVEEISLPYDAPSEITVYKCGRLVTMAINSCTARVLARLRLTLPYSAKPIEDLSMSVTEAGSGCFMRINGDGSVYFVNVSDEQARVNQTITYISKN